MAVSLAPALSSPHIFSLSNDIPASRLDFSPSFRPFDHRDPSPASPSVSPTPTTTNGTMPGRSPPTSPMASSSSSPNLASGSQLKADSKPFSPSKRSVSPATGGPSSRLSPSPSPGGVREPHSSIDSSASSTGSLTPNGAPRQGSISPGLPPSPGAGRSNGNEAAISRSSSYTTLPSISTQASSGATSATSSPSLGSASGSGTKQAGPASQQQQQQQPFPYQPQQFPPQQHGAFGPNQFAFPPQMMPNGHFQHHPQQQQAMDMYMQAYHQQQQYAQRQMAAQNQPSWGADGGRRRATSGPAPPSNQYFFDPHNAPPLPYHPTAFMHHTPYGPVTTVGMMPHGMHAPHPGPHGNFMPPFVPQISPLHQQQFGVQQPPQPDAAGYHPYRRGSPRSDASPNPGRGDREWERERQGSVSGAAGYQPPSPFYMQSSQGRGSSSSVNSAGKTGTFGNVARTASPIPSSGSHPSLGGRSMSVSSATPSPSNSGSNSASSRSRTNSTSSQSSGAPPRFGHQANSSVSSVGSDKRSPGAGVGTFADRDRRPSVSTSERSVTPTQTAAASAASQALKKPSPLSQQTFSAQSGLESGRTTPQSGRTTPVAPRRRNTDEDDRLEVMGAQRAGEDDGADSDDTASERAVGPGHVRGRPSMSSTIRTESTVQAAIGPSAKQAQQKKSLGSKFKRALSMTSTSELQQGSSSASSSAPTAITSAQLEQAGQKGRPSLTNSAESADSSTPPRTPPNAAGLPARGVYNSNASINGDIEVPVAPGGRSVPMRSTPSGRRFGLLNSKMNSSTDNISISSTVSSASVMIRKLGNMGKLARRHSLMGLTKVFKGKGEEEGDDVSSTDAASRLRDTRSEMGVEIATKKMKKDKKKGLLSSASVAHVTVELDRDLGASTSMANDPRFAGMTPAAAMVKKHQLMYAQEEEARAAAAAQERAAQEKAEEAARGKTSDEQDGQGGKSKMLEREKEKLKNRKPRKWGIGFGGSSSSSSSNAAAAAASTSEHGHVRTGSFDSSRPSADDFGTEESYEDRTPRQSVEILNDLPKIVPGGASFMDAETVANAAESGADADAVLEEYDIASLRTWGPGGERRARRLPAPDAKPPKGILKYAKTYNQEDFNPQPRAGFLRERADSYNAPTQHTAPSERANAALVQTIPSGDQVDGLVDSATEVRKDTRPGSPNGASETLSGVSSGVGGIYSNPSMNASAPVLSRIAGGLNAGPARDQRPAAAGRRLVFAANLSVHTTWPAAVYDRRAEPATCNRLTPALAQRIKEELNAFKMEEMEVHHLSRTYTHFFL